jgi:hypothetical protein
MEKIKLAAALLEENSELEEINKEKKHDSKNLYNIDFFQDMKEDENDNIFISILDKYKLNGFDLLSIIENNNEDVKINLDLENQNDIDFLLYRIVTHLNTPLIYEKEEESIKIHMKDLENKIDIIIGEINKNKKKREKIVKVKSKIQKEIEKIEEIEKKENKLYIENIKTQKMNKKISEVKKNILNNILIIKEYVNKKIKRK